VTASIRNRPEAVPVGFLLSAVGGYLDAYTYVGHGGVFANAQTGNVVLLAVAVAFVAALQVSTFKKVGDVGYNATVTTGNLRSLVAEFAGWWSERHPGAGRRTAVLGGIVVSFAAGAAVGTGLTLVWGDGAAAAAAGAIVVVLVAIVAETRRRERASGTVEGDDGAGGR
jgi:uncharacterized membrane protein YoaK (UPF0700 family)